MAPVEPAKVGRAGHPTARHAVVVSRRVAAFLVVLALAMTPVTRGQAAQESANLEDKLAKLNKRADSLTKKYRGQLVQLDHARSSAKKAMQRTERINQKLRKARADAAQLASEKYKNTGTAPVLSLLSSDSSHALRRATTLTYLARTNNRQVSALKSLAGKAVQARKKAKKRVNKVKKQVDKLAKQRDKVAKLVEKFEAQQPVDSGGGTDTGSDGANSSGDDNTDTSDIPSADNITPRMSRVRKAIIAEFGSAPTVGCYRPDDSGEHPEGRACDFMLSSGGEMPSDSQVERGRNIAQWCIENADEYGIMYVIYRQRIWDARSGEGWESMEDRGGVTANHYDHVHVSVF